jgi:hypothetical protein
MVRTERTAGRSMKLVITALLVAVAVNTSTGAVPPVQVPALRLELPSATPRPAAAAAGTQAGYGPGRPHKCLRYDWTCEGGPVQPLPPLASDFAPHGVEGRQHLENSPYAPTEPPPAMKQWL